LARKLTDTVQLKLRFGEKLRRRLEKEATRRGHSLNTEIINRLEESFDYGEWQESRERLVTAMMSDLASHPNPAATRSALGNMRDAAELYIQNELEQEGLFPGKGK
jgi:hypothetical protein